MFNNRYDCVIDNDRRRNVRMNQCNEKTSTRQDKQKSDNNFQFLKLGHSTCIQ